MLKRPTGSRSAEIRQRQAPEADPGHEHTPEADISPATTEHNASNQGARLGFRGKSKNEVVSGPREARNYLFLLLKALAEKWFDSSIRAARWRERR